MDSISLGSQLTTAINKGVGIVATGWNCNICGKFVEDEYNINRSHICKDCYKKLRVIIKSNQHDRFYNGGWKK